MKQSRKPYHIMTGQILLMMCVHRSKSKCKTGSSQVADKLISGSMIPNDPRKKDLIIGKKAFT